MASSAGSIHALELARRREVAPLDLAEQLDDVGVGKGGPAGQQAVEGGAQAVDVAGRTQLVNPAGGLLGAHVGRGSQPRPELRPAHVAARLGDQGAVVQRRRRRCGLSPTHALGQAPVDDQGLAVLAQHDVARLEVAMEHAAAVGVVDGVADVEEPAQELLVQRQSRPRATGAAAFTPRAW